MIIMNTVGDTIVAQCGSASALTISVYGVETNAGVDTYKKLGQNQVAQAASTTTIYTVPSSTSTVVSEFVLANTTSGDVTCSVWHVPNGGSFGDTNAIIRSVTVSANKSVVWNRGNATLIPPVVFSATVTDPASAVLPTQIFS